MCRWMMYAWMCSTFSKTHAHMGGLAGALPFPPPLPNTHTHAMVPQQPQGPAIDAGAMLKGVVGLRTWIVVGYIALLHFVVMLQFHNRHVDLEAACAHAHPLP